MCCTHRREGIKKFVGSLVDVAVPASAMQPAKNGQAVWSGFSQIENHEYWKREADAVPVSLLMDSFTESKVELRVPTGRVAALGLRKSVSINGKLVGKAKTVKMLTREARNEFEKTLHCRWPVVVVNGKFHEFTQADVIDSKDDSHKQTELPF